MTWEGTAPLTQLPGIGPARGKKLDKLGLRRLEDVLDYFPFRYEDRRAVVHRPGRPGGGELLRADHGGPHPYPSPGSARGWNW